MSLLLVSFNGEGVRGRVPLEFGSVCGRRIVAIVRIIATAAFAVPSGRAVVMIASECCHCERLIDVRGRTIWGLNIHKHI
jgi:hypothetical protein